MPINNAEWSSITAAMENVAKEISGRRTDYFRTAKVIRRDTQNKLVWVDVFGSQPIPIVGFDYDVKYYDEGASGVVNVKKAVVTVHVPEVGENVLIAYELGLRRLARCLGVLKGTGWIEPEEG